MVDHNTCYALAPGWIFLFVKTRVCRSQRISDSLPPFLETTSQTQVPMLRHWAILPTEPSLQPTKLHSSSCLGPAETGHKVTCSLTKGCSLLPAASITIIIIIGVCSLADPGCCVHSIPLHGHLLPHSFSGTSRASGAMCHLDSIIWKNFTALKVTTVT